MNQIFSDLPVVAAYKDKESRFVSVTSYCKKVLGFQAKDDICGLTDSEIPCGVSEKSSEFRLQDIEVMSGKDLSILDVHEYADGGFRSFITRKTRTVGENGAVTGVVCVGREVCEQEWLAVIQTLTEDMSPFHEKGSLSWEISGKPFGAFGLSPRLSECLFWMIRGKTAQEMASQMGLSRRTVESYTEDLKNKMCCEKKSEIVEKAVEAGCLYKIPQNVLSRGAFRVSHPVT